MTSLDSIFKSRDITLPTKVHLVKAMVFPGVMYGCERWTVKKADCLRIDAFELWCWRRLLRVPWTARRSNQSILKEISPEYSLEGLMLKLKLQYFGNLMWRTDIGKDSDAGKGWMQEEKGITEDEMVGWHYQRNAHEFEQTLNSVQLLSHVLLFATPWTAALQASLSNILEPPQTHVHRRVHDAIQLSHPLLSPSPPAFRLSQQQGLFRWVSSSHQVAKALEFQLQHQSFHWMLGWFH